MFLLLAFSDDKNNLSVVKELTDYIKVFIKFIKDKEMNGTISYFTLRPQKAPLVLTKISMGVGSYF